MYCPVCTAQKNDQSISKQLESQTMLRHVSVYHHPLLHPTPHANKNVSKGNAKQEKNCFLPHEQKIYRLRNHVIIVVLLQCKQCA